jgi:hypothetical protein
MREHWNRQVANERGATAVLVAVCLTTLIAAAALAVDLGMMFDSRTEAQRVADAAALAGAASYMTALDQEDADAQAILWAEQYGAQNTVRGQPVLPADMQITPDFVEGTVEVIVTRGQIPTWFARIFGQQTMQVSGRAVAQVMESGSVGCLKPFIIPDAWWEKGGDPLAYDGPPLGTSADEYDPAVTGYGTSFRNPYAAGGQVPTPDELGNPVYEDVGRLIVMKSGSPGSSPQPGWFFPFSLSGNGASNYREDIANPCSVERLSVGQQIWKEQGNMVGPTLQGLEDLIALDPNATWNQASKAIENSAFGGGTGYGSPRVVQIPLFDPTDLIPNGKKQITIHSFGSMFVEEVSCTKYKPNGQCNDKDDERTVRGRWLPVQGLADNCRATGTAAPTSSISGSWSSNE